MARILVTGANGFVGRRLCAEIAQRGKEVLRAVRVVRKTGCATENVVEVGDIDGNTDWAAPLAGVESIVHLAARVHVMREVARNPLAQFRRVNVEGTLNLARQAVTARVQRFVFISSIGVNGAETFDVPFTAADKVAPHSPYAASKYEAEVGLRQIALETGLEVATIRPPLVIGPDAPGNFDQLTRAILRGIPLPLGAVRNQRSLVALDNLVDLIATCLHHEKAVNQTFLVSDGEDLSTTQLLRRLGLALGKPARLLAVPPVLLRTAGALFGKQDIVQRLCGSLQVDISKTRALLGWSPSITVDEGLRRAAQWYLEGGGDQCGTGPNAVSRIGDII